MLLILALNVRVQYNYNCYNIVERTINMTYKKKDMDALKKQLKNDPKFQARTIALLTIQNCPKLQVRFRMR